MRTSGFLSLGVAALALSACVEIDATHMSSSYLERYAMAAPTLAQFPECRGFGCAVTSRVSLNKEEWRRVVAVFRPPAKDAQEERQRVARAVAVMELLVGRKTGSAAHQWTHKDMIISRNHGDKTQLDCIDTSVNTWTYLTMMDRDGLLRFHRVDKLAHVDDLLNMRNTAVLEEKTSGDRFAIDPSLVDTGVPPPIMPIAVWLGSWPPNIKLAETRVDIGK